MFLYLRKKMNMNMFQMGMFSPLIQKLLNSILLFLCFSIHINGQEKFRISTFDMDVTPPPGSHYLAYDPQVGTWDLGLRAKGIEIGRASCREIVLILEVDGTR